MTKSGYDLELSEIKKQIKSLGGATGIGALKGAIAVYASAKKTLVRPPAADTLLKSYVAAGSALERLGLAIMDYALKDGRGAMKAAYRAAGIKEDFSGKPRLSPDKADGVISSAERYISNLRDTFDSSGLGVPSTDAEFNAFGVSLKTLRNLLENKE